MAVLNITIDLPCEKSAINISDLKSKLTAFAKFMLSSPTVALPKEATKEADPFAELDTTWGGDRDANEIANELYAMRANTRTIDAW